jgi:hypothetical protein
VEELFDDQLFKKKTFLISTSRGNPT